MYAVIASRFNLGRISKSDMLCSQRHETNNMILIIITSVVIKGGTGHDRLNLN